MSRRRDQPRLAAARAVGAVLGGKASLASLLPVELARFDDPRQRALVQELAYGTLRWYHRLDTLLEKRLSRPLKRKDSDIKAVLLVGLYQLTMLEIPAHAAVSETVDAVRGLGKSWASSLVNGVLRQVQRDSGALQEAAVSDPVARWSHPQWWIERMRADWPQHWQAVLAANNERPPMVLRVNARQCDRDSYLRRLHDSGIEAVPSPVAEQGITLAHPVAVDALPGFADGAVSVQDAAAQLAAPLLQLDDGQRVLDACAAPGGKTGHILEIGKAPGEVVAIDSDPDRLARVEENLERLQLSAGLVAADAADTAQWWDGRPFERILLDAPCSASGVVRRHPDIKLLRRAADPDGLAAQQLRLLDALWPLLATGGMLLYVTCSVFRKENAETLQRFLQAHPDARESPLEVDWGHAEAVGRQVLPGEQGMDGFYFARLSKT